VNDAKSPNAALPNDRVLAWVRDVLATTAPRWLNLTEALPEALLRRPAAPGEWSAAQCLEHLLATERQVFPPRVRVFLRGGDIVPFDPDQEAPPRPVMSPVQMAGEFARLRAASLELLAGLEPSDLARTAHHGEYGTVTLAEQLNEWAAHDLMHTVQAERALMQPFLPGTGPWRPSFSDHDVTRG